MKLKGLNNAALMINTIADINQKSDGNFIYTTIFVNTSTGEVIASAITTRVLRISLPDEWKSIGFTAEHMEKSELRIWCDMAIKQAQAT